MRKAQRAALTGRGAAGLRDLAAERRKSVDDLTKKAIKHLGASGDAQREAIAGSLEAALASEDAADQLREGRLVKPLEMPSGFGDEIPGLSVVPDPPDGATKESTAEASARERRRAARAERRGAAHDDGDTTQQRQQQKQQQELERLADEKAAALERAKEEAQAAAREAAAARAEVSRLQDALVTANGRAKAAAERARVAQWTQSQAQQELDAATRRALDGS